MAGSRALRARATGSWALTEKQATRGSDKGHKHHIGVQFGVVARETGGAHRVDGCHHSPGHRDTGELRYL